MTKEDYAKKAFQWAKALKLLDPSIELILCGKEGKDDWDYYVLKECVTNHTETLGNGGGTLIDMHSIHRYTSSNDHLENVTGKLRPDDTVRSFGGCQLIKSMLGPRAAERSIEITGAMIDFVHIENKIPPTVKKQKICFDEWNVWDPTRAIGSEGAEEKCVAGATNRHVQVSC